MKVIKLSKNEFQVQVEHEGRLYKDNISLPGLKNLIENHDDQKSKQYKILVKMLDAINNSLNKTEGGSNATLKSKRTK